MVYNERNVLLDTKKHCHFHVDTERVFLFVYKPMLDWRHFLIVCFSH
jgi:hypothetical protein